MLIVMVLVDRSWRSGFWLAFCLLSRCGEMVACSHCGPFQLFVQDIKIIASKSPCIEKYTVRTALLNSKGTTSRNGFDLASSSR